jgi:hypothetical protein
MLETGRLSEGGDHDVYKGTARQIPDSRARQARDESMKCW